MEVRIFPPLGQVDNDILKQNIKGAYKDIKKAALVSGVSVEYLLKVAIFEEPFFNELVDRVMKLVDLPKDQVVELMANEFQELGEELNK